VFRNLRSNPSLTVVIGLTVLSWSLIFGYRSSVPNAEDWSSAVDYVRSVRSEQDGLTWIPHYVEEGTPLFSGLNAFETPDLTSPDFSRFERVWVLASHGESPKGFPGFLSAELVHEQGAIGVWRVENHGERVVADLYRDLESVVVRQGTQGECDFWSGNGWHCLHKSRRERTRSCLKESTAQRLNRFRRKRSPHCGLSPWFHVSRDVRVIDRSPRRCVWVHPKKREPFTVDWPVNISADDLVIRYGFTDRVISMHSRPTPRTQPAQLQITGLESPVSVDIKPVAGWFEKRLSVQITPPHRTLRLTVTTSSPVDGHFCMDVTLRKRGRQ